jgi:hypothetical protein
MIAVCGRSKQTTTCGELPKVINTDHHQKPACAGCIGLRLRPRPHAVVEHSKSRRPQLPRVGAVSLISAYGPKFWSRGDDSDCCCPIAAGDGAGRGRGLAAVLSARQMILDIIGYLLADGRQLKHLILDDRIVGTLGKLPTHHRLVP